MIKGTQLNVCVCVCFRVQLERFADGLISAVGSNARTDAGRLADEIANWVQLRLGQSRTLPAGAAVGQLKA